MHAPPSAAIFRFRLSLGRRGWVHGALPEGRQRKSGLAASGGKTAASLVSARWCRSSPRASGFPEAEPPDRSSRHNRHGHTAATAAAAAAAAGALDRFAGTYEPSGSCALAGPRPRRCSESARAQSGSADADAGRPIVVGAAGGDLRLGHLRESAGFPFPTCPGAHRGTAYLCTCARACVPACARARVRS